LQSAELTENTGGEYLPWVAQYLVMKRASIEHNFHTLYSNFIDHLKKPEFLTVVIAETYRNIKVQALIFIITRMFGCAGNLLSPPPSPVRSQPCGLYYTGASSPGVGWACL